MDRKKELRKLRVEQRDLIVDIHISEEWTHYLRYKLKNIKGRIDLYIRGKDRG